MNTGLFDRFLGRAVFGSALQTYKSMSGSAYIPLDLFSISLILLKYENGLFRSFIKLVSLVVYTMKVNLGVPIITIMVVLGTS